MILIADSGATKTDWRFIDEDKKIQQYSCQGISPYFYTTQEIVDILKSELAVQLMFDINHPTLEVYYYGTGCTVPDKKELIKQALKTIFKNATIEVNSDLLGAARALCGKQPGIAAILGTGANTCYYDGTDIIENTASLGFVLGDEGSGAHIGKTFIQAYLNKELPTTLAQNFYDRYQLDEAAILDAVYKQAMPSRFLASFSKFVYQNLKNQFILDLVVSCFNDFFDKHICKYSKANQLKLSCVGSIAFYFSDVLRKVANNKGIDIDKIIESPIAGLTLYYTETE
jgi:N-acetylglucosamine kinase-like BadF-type ATPase